MWVEMKFDFIIGNPPYQDDTVGDQKNYGSPVYHQFLDVAYGLADKVEMVHPARFLFGAGSTPKDWNKKMLSDEHLKVLQYNVNSTDLFPTTDIKGGVCVTYRDANSDFGAIEHFIVFSELRSCLSKVKAVDGVVFDNIGSIITSQTNFNLVNLFADYPEFKSLIGSGGKDKRLESNSFEKMSVFTHSRVDTTDICILGVVKNKRTYRYISFKYVDMTQLCLNKYKVFVPTSNGSGALGEVLSTPLVGKPLVGHTRTFMSIGAFDFESEAEACLRYVKSKFARAMLGICKVTQAATPDKWRYVPLQDFTANSDIDWSKSVAEIDQQLYKKYGLDDSEIEFIETHVMAME